MTLFTALFISEEDQHMCHTFIVPLPIWISGIKGQIHKVFKRLSSCGFVNCDLKILSFHRGAIKIFELFSFGEKIISGEIHNLDNAYT